MININDLKDKIEHSVIALSSVNKEGKPHNIAVMFIKVKENKIVITNNYINTTIENIKNNPLVSIVFWKGDKGFIIDGKAKHYDSGKWLKFIKSIKENKPHPKRGALVVDIDNIKEI